MLAAGGICFWAWLKVESLPKDVRERTTLLEQIFRRKGTTEFVFPTVETRSQTREHTLAIVSRLVAEHPNLKIESRSVPTEENGFLQLHLLPTSASGTGLPISHEFATILRGTAGWDPDAARRELAQHADLVKRIERIAALKERSSSGMPDDYMGFIQAATGKQAAEILLLKARLAALEHDEENALHFVSATINLANHYHDVEMPNLLGETVAILIDLSVRQCVFEHVLPALGREIRVERWRAVLVPTGYTPPAFARLMTGEWNTTARYLLLPMVLASRGKDKVPDPEALAGVFASRFSTYVERLQHQTLLEMTEGPDTLDSRVDWTLSEKSRDIMSVLFIGTGSWAKGYVRAAAMLAQQQAALELLGREQDGEPLFASLSADPITGQRFLYDPTRRTIDAPDNLAKIEVAPLKLPW